MEEKENSLKEFLAVVRRRKGMMFITFMSLLVLSVIATFLWPPTYRSTATILIRDQEIPRDLVPSTITSFADQRLMEIQARVVTSANLARLIEDFDLYPDDRKRLPPTEVVIEMREDYSLDLVSADVIDPRTGRPTQATILFTVSFDYEDAAIAQQVTNRLVDLYLNENLRDRTERAQETTSFLSEQADKLDREIKQLENRLATFKERSGGALPELYSVNLSMMERTENELREVLRQIQALGQQQIYLQSQLATVSQAAPVYGNEGVVLPPDQQLIALQSQYTSASAKYGANHPDVISLRRQIEALKGEAGVVTDLSAIETDLQTAYAELTQAKQRYGAQHPDVLQLERQYERLLQKRDTAQAASQAADAPPPQPEVAATNPAYINLATQYSANDGTLRSLKISQAQLQAKLQDYENRIVQSPQIEREYSSITRDLDSARLKYSEIHSKQLVAEVSESLEQGRKGERFEVVEPALLPTLPHTPNRLALLFLGLVLSMAGSVGTTAVSESMDSAVYGANSLATVLGATPIAIIPFIYNEYDEQRSRRSWVMIGSGLVAAMLIALLLIHFLYKPLDVLWFVVLRHLGI